MIDPKRPVLTTVFDRLMDDRPHQKEEARIPPSQLLRDLRNSVRRDLENLLNSRISAISFPPHLTELRQSVVGYGIPDIGGADLGTARKRKEFLKTVESVIRCFEPRFKTVKVLPVEGVDTIDRTLRFRIEAFMYADPVPESVVFDSAFEAAEGHFRVKGV